MIDERRDSLHREDHKRPSLSQAAPAFGERPTKIISSRHERPSAQAGRRIGPHAACPRDDRDGAPPPDRDAGSSPRKSPTRRALPGISRSRTQESRFADMAAVLSDASGFGRTKRTTPCPARSQHDLPHPAHQDRWAVGCAQPTRAAAPLPSGPQLYASAGSDHHWAADLQRCDSRACTGSRWARHQRPSVAGSAGTRRNRPGLRGEVESHGHDRCRKGDPVILRPGRPQRRPWSAQHLIRALTQ